MLKIANIIEEGRFGGPQRWISAVSGRLKDFGFNQIVIFPVLDSNRFYEELNQQKIETRRIDLHRLTKEKKHLIKFVFLFIPEVVSLYRLFKKECIDIVYCNNSWQFKGVIAGKLAGKKVIWHLHETSTPFCVNIIFNFLATYCVNAFIVAGERARNYYLSDKKLSVKPILQVQTPIEVAVFDPRKVEKDKRIVGYSGLNIITIGNVNPAKGLEYFVEMASILNKKYDNLNFFIIGPHIDSQRIYSDKIFKLVKQYDLKNLHFYGQSGSIPAVLKAADVYVCSSITEASPASVWEAMSMKKAIVSTDVGDVAKLIKDGESGYIVPVKNALAIAKKVGILIKNVELRKRVGINAREIAVKNLDVNICVKKMLNFIEKL